MIPEVKKVEEFIVPKAFKKELMDNETVLAITAKHKLWILGFWLNPLYLILSILTIGMFFLYKLHLMKNEIIILTDKRIIGSLNPKLLTKDKIELTLNGIDNIVVDESVFGNIFGWSMLIIETRSAKYKQKILTKKSVSNLKNEFYKLVNEKI